MPEQNKLILLGAGGHAKVLLSLIQVAGLPLWGVCDPGLVKQGLSVWRGVPVLGDDSFLDGIDPKTVNLVHGIGQRVNDSTRRVLFERYKNKDFSFQTVTHPFSFVDATARLKEGVQVMVGVVIQPDVVIGDNVILNTKASVDHDCRIEDNVHIAPGAILCGTVSVGEGAFIASGAVIGQGVRIGAGAVIGAGASVVRDVPAGQVIIPGSMKRSVKKEDHPVLS